MTQEKRDRVLWGVTAALMLVSVAVLYVTHREIPFMMDDLWYATKLSTEEPITGFGDIVESQIWHYHNWGGRSITHGLLQLILLWGERMADVLNVLATLVLSGVICLMAGSGRNARRLPLYFGAFSMVLGLNANWKMSMFWQAGAANYLYITIFILFFLWCYLREVPEPEPEKFSIAAGADTGSAGEQKARSPLPGISFWIFPLGLMAGWSNENMGPAVWVVSLLAILQKYKDSRELMPGKHTSAGLAARKFDKIPLWMILGNLACLAGSILVIAAPGNFVRSVQADPGYGALWQLYLRCYAEATAALNYLFPVLLVLAGVLILGVGLMKLPLGPRNALLLLGALLSWGAMLLSPHYPDRATFGTMVLLICVILSVVRRIVQEREDLKIWLWGAGLLIWLRGMFFLGEYLGLTWGWIR